MAAVEQDDVSPGLDGLVASDRKVRNRKGILDPAVLDAAILSCWNDTETIEAFRSRLLQILKYSMAAGRSEVERRFLETNDGAGAVRANAYMMDRIIQAICQVATERVYRVHNPTQGELLAVVAVGGYGRGELAPFSDIDLMFVLPYKMTPHVEQVVEFVLYLLWDLGLKVGHSTRSVEECIRQSQADMTIRTALLEARYLWGEMPLFTEFRDRFAKEIVDGSALEFVEAKLAEADERHKRLGDSRYVTEPNIKDGKGGLRDLHRLFWIGKYVYQVEKVSALVERQVLTLSEARRFAKAQKQLWTIRCHLHYLSARAEERLTVDVQSEIARRMGYTDHAGSVAVERFMKHYFLIAKDVGDLTRIFCAAIEAEHQRRPRLRIPRLLSRKRDTGDFTIDRDRLNVKSDNVFEHDPVNLIRLFHFAQKYDLEFHPRALRLVTQNLKRIDAKLRRDEEANRLFMEILTAPNGPERILRRMNEAQVFGRFVPDFGRVVAQMQYDMYHVYTVDEHTIIMLGILHQIEQGELAEVAPIATDVVHKVLSRRELYVAVLLHDIAKGRGGDHSKLGEKVARRICPRLGMTAEETETVAWLVRWHLLMSYAAFKRDVNDPQTITDFTDIVQSPERLRLLLCLTVADIRAVGPNVWNGWKAALLRELYYRAEEVLSGETIEDGVRTRSSAARDALREHLSDWTDADFDDHVARGHSAYWLAFDVETHARQANIIRTAEQAEAPLAVDMRVDEWREVTEVTVYAADHPGLFWRIAGAMAASGAGIVDARIFTMRNGMALDVFWIQDLEERGAITERRRLDRLTRMIERGLKGEVDLRAEIARREASLPKRMRGMKVPPRVLIDNKASVTHTVVEVNATDRPGVLYRITRALATVNVQIQTAKISTYGESFVDVFYVKDLFGLKIESERKLDEIRKTLMAALKPEKAKKKAETVV